MFAIDDILSYITDFCCDVVKSNVAELKDQKKLLKKLTDYVETKFNIEIIQTDLKFDYQGFLNYIKANAIEDIKVYLCELDLKANRDQKDLIVAKALNHSSSQGQKESEELAEKLILNILEIVKDFYTSKVEIEKIVVLKDIIRQNTEVITENSNKNKDEIITTLNMLIQSQSFKQFDSKFITLPPEHLSSEICDLRETDVVSIIEKINLNKKRIFLTSIGGVGKTTIAKELYHKLKDNYECIAWIPYQNNLSDSILSSFLLYPDITPQERIDIIIEFLLNKKSNLLVIIDDVTNDISHDKMLRTFAGMDATVLLTTRLTNISSFTEYRINFLNKEKAIKVFYLYYKYDSEKAQKETVEKLVMLAACHTLTVELLAKGANVPGTEIKQYYNNLVTKGFGFPSIKVKTNHNETAHTIVEHLRLLYDMSTVTPEEARVLQVFAFLPRMTMPAALSEWIKCDISVLDNLSEIGWLNANQEGYFMHQVIVDTLRLNNCDPNCIGVLVKYILKDKFFDETENYMKTRLKLEVAKSVLDYYIFNSKVELLQIYNIIGIVEQKQGCYKTGLYFFEKALVIGERILVKEHPSIAAIYNNIAGVCQYQGNFDKALEFYNKALLIRENVLGTEHMDTATTYNNIAGVYQYQGNFDKALEFYNKALLIRENVLGTEHMDTATTYNNIAGVYQYQGNYDKMLEFCNKALLIRENVLGTEHISTATTYNNIAVVYKNQGEYEKALEFYNKALLIIEKLLGKDHPDAATIYNNIAGVYQGQGDYNKALEFYNKALLISEKVLGKEHLDTITTYNNVALVYQDQGDYDKALEFCDKALLISEKVLGKDHPDTAKTYNNIAEMYQDQGDYAKALEFYNKAYCSFFTKIGSEHPLTKIVYNNAKNCYFLCSKNKTPFDKWLQENR